MKSQKIKYPTLTFILGGARSGKSDYALESARTLAGDDPVLFIATATAGDDEMRDRIAQHQTERPHHWQTLEAPLDVGTTLADYLDEYRDEYWDKYRDDSPDNGTYQDIEEYLANNLPDYLPDYLPDPQAASQNGHRSQPPDAEPAVLLLDCLSLLVSNVLFADGRSGEDEPMHEIQARLDAEIDALLDVAQESGKPLLVVSNEVGMGIVPMGRVSRTYRDLLGRANRRVAGAADRAIFVVAGIPLNLSRLRATDVTPLLSS